MIQMKAGPEDGLGTTVSYCWPFKENKEAEVGKNQNQFVPSFDRKHRPSFEFVRGMLVSAARP